MLASIAVNPRSHSVKNCVLALAFGALLVSSGPSALQAATPSHDQAALEFLEAIGIEKIVAEISSALANNLIRTNPPLAAHRDIILAWSNKYVTWEAAAPELVGIYTKAFTEPELKEITRFYGTPTGRKMAEHLPGLMESVAAAGGRLAGAHIADLQKMLEDKAKQQPQGGGEQPKSP
jgi:hypothetical protein